MKKHLPLIIAAIVGLIFWKKFGKSTPASKPFNPLAGLPGSGGILGGGSFSPSSNTTKTNGPTGLTGGGTGTGGGPGGSGSGSGPGSNTNNTGGLLGGLGNLLNGLGNLFKGGGSGGGAGSGVSTNIPLPKPNDPAKNQGNGGQGAQLNIDKGKPNPEFQDPVWKANQSGISDRYENPNPEEDPGGELEAGGSNPFDTASEASITTGDNSSAVDFGGELSNDPFVQGNFGGDFGGWDTVDAYNNYVAANPPSNTWQNPNTSNYNFGGGTSSYGGAGTDTGWQYNSVNRNPSGGFDTSSNSWNDPYGGFGGNNWQTADGGIDNSGNGWDLTFNDGWEGY